jgi:diguanylate cyclase (GGDEF)-like protein
MSIAPQRSHKTRARNSPMLSIRARLIVVALLAVVPLVLDRVRVLEGTRTERIEDAAAQAAELVRRGAQGQHEIINNVRALLQMSARFYVGMARHGESCTKILAGFAPDLPWIKSLSVVDANGRVACSTSSSAVGLDVSDRAYYRTAIETRDFVLSEYLVDRARRQPAIIAAYPIQAKGETAVIIASVDPPWLAQLSGTAGRRAGTTIFVIDRAGTVLARNPDPDGLAGKHMADHPLVREVLARSEGSITTMGIDGTDGIFAFLPIPATDAHLVVGLDQREVLSRIDREISIAYLQLGLIGVLVLFFAWFGGERLIAEPIRALARTAARFGRGELNVRPPQDGLAAEFRPLAAALDEMARKLAERERALRLANEHLAGLASVDSLCGLANRRGFDMRLRSEWLQAGKLARPIALLMIDVDHFKLFNDTYGHLEGDECLRRVGKVLAGGAGQQFAARYGGEEFALLLPGARIDKAMAVGERLRRAVEDLRIINAAAPSGALTVSIGVASLAADVGEDEERLVEAADAGLYAAKRRGRNAVVAHAPIVLSDAS